MNFDAAFDEVIKHEGSFVDHPLDKGGATRWGVTEAVARENGYEGKMQDFPIELAKRIYRDSYWAPIRADLLPPVVRYAVFDAAINSGVRRAVIWLQEAVGAKADGIIGPQTLALVRDTNHEKLLRVYLSRRLAFMASLSNWPAFGRGWARRIAALLEM